MRHQIFVPGVPRPQDRPRTFYKGGKIITFSPKSDWHKAVVLAARFKRPKKPLEGALYLRAEFVYKAPAKKPQGQMKASTPDVDNLLKGLMDQLQEAGWFKNDSQVAEVHAIKLWRLTSSVKMNLGMFVTVEEVAA